ncbi:pupal cuticle protein 36a-like [Anthonomus grandis grandis]|uniref:pupal cuticle protein 36a-like n=1 Tax=Anthonomus grandis grandis TaxID=2921223 RepID=UPI002166A0FE|nr:pupal cuticle protein 36a-like [Anthonomus grandis grandis]
MRFLILASILTIVSCASLDNIAYLPPNQKSANSLSNQYLPASNQLSIGAFGNSLHGRLESTSGTFSLNQNGKGFSSNGAIGGFPSKSFGASEGSLNLNKNGAFGNTNSGFRHSSGSVNFNQPIQAGFRQSSNQQGLSTSYGGYSGAGNALGSSQTDFKKNANQVISGLSSGATSFKNQASSGYSGYSSSSSSANSFGGNSLAAGQISLKNSEKSIPILKLAADNNGDGTYKYNYETANSISAEEQGDARNGGTRAQGSFGYSAPDGQQISISYTADENGFLPQGSHIPTPPPIPEAILKSIEENAAAAAQGNYNEGAYRGEGLNTRAYNSAGTSSSSNFQGSFGSNTNGNLQTNAAYNGGYKY